MKKHRLAIIFIFICLLSVGSSKDTELLKEYQRIVQETKAIRQISIKEAGLKADDSCEDMDGNLWFYGDGNIRRFNGISFQDMFEHYPAAERDSLKGIVSLDDKTLLAYGARYVYEWDGTNFKRYLFDEDDSIDRVIELRHSALFIGVGGYTYAFFEEGKLSLHKTTLSLLERPNTAFIWDQKGNLHVTYGQQSISGKRNGLFVLNYSYALSQSKEDLAGRIGEWDRDVYVLRFSPAIEDSLKILDSETLNNLLKSGREGLPDLYNDSEGETWTYLRESNFIVKLDANMGTIASNQLDESIRILTIEGTKAGRDLVFYQWDDKYYLCELADFVSGAETAKQVDFGSRSILNSQVYLYLDGEIIFLLTGKLADYASGHREILLMAQDDDKDGFVVWDTNEQMNMIFGREGYREDQSLLIFDKDSIVICYPSPDIPKVQLVVIYDKQGVLQQSFSIADGSSSWRFVDFNRVSNTLILVSANSYYVIPVTKGLRQISSTESIKVSGKEQSNREGICLVGTNAAPLLMSAYLVPNSQPLRYDYQLYNANEHKPQVLSEIKGAEFLHHDKDRGILYFRFYKKRDKQEILRYNLQTHKAEPICEISESDKVLFCKDQFLICSYREYSIFRQDKMVDKGNFSIFENEFAGLVQPYQDGIASLWNSLTASAYDGEGNIIFDKQAIQADPQKTRISKGFSFFDFQSDFVSQPYLYEDGYAELRFPAFVINIKADKIVYHPSWHRASNTCAGIYIQHLVHEEGKISSLISSFAKGTLKESNADIAFQEDSEFIGSAYIRGFGTLSVVLANQALYFRKGEKKSEIDLNQYKVPGTYIGTSGKGNLILEQNSILWINLGSSLLKHDTGRNLTFQYGEEAGLPGKIEDFWIDPHGLVYILGDTGLYTLQQETTDLSLKIPWFNIGKSRHSSAQPLRLKHKQNSIIIPVEIPNTLYPEKCILEYRMKGLEKDWQRTQYKEAIEYQRLRPGSYVFEILAFSPEGNQSDLLSYKIRILPPWYAAWWAYLLYALISICALKLFYDGRVRKLKTDRERLAKQVDEATLEIREQHLKLSESIEYASLIQRSVLPPDEEMNQAFREFFVIWKPRDVVGGDFYWLYRVPESGEVLFAVIDCTGHGVPGALLSMTVNTLLNNIVKERGERRLGEILSCLHREIAGTLHQKNANSQQDGLAISILKYMPGSGQVAFAGGGHKLIYYDGSNKEIKLVKGSKHSLGGAKWHEELFFEEHVLPENPASVFYLYSDGIIDQPCLVEDRIRRLGTDRFTSLLERVATLPLAEQARELNDELDKLVRENEQRDDICVAGLQLIDKCAE